MLLPVQPGELRTVVVASGAVVMRSCQRSSSTSSTLRMFAGRGAGFAVGERLARGLDVPRVVVATLDPRAADPDRARARQPADLGRVTRAEGEVLEPVLARDERVLVLVRAVDHAVARSYLVHVPVLPREPRAGEHEEDLLGGRVRVWRRRQHPGLDAHAVHADGPRPGRMAESLPRRIHLSLRAAEGVDLVPVRERHDSESRRRRTS